MATFDINDYATVNDRIQEFYKKYKEGSIQTEILSNENGVIIFKAYIYKTPDDNRPTVGHAMEKEGSTFINKTSHIENCETSAVGRALAMMGFCIKKSIASKEEVENAKLNQNNEKSVPVAAPKIPTINATQQKQLFAIANNKAKVVKDILIKHKLTQSKEVLVSDFDLICKEIEEEMKKTP